MESLKTQNAKLAMLIQDYLDQIEKQKQINSQHETQIETLLLFNQRLLSIIQSQIDQKKKEGHSLQPISERSERSSDLFGKCPIESLIRSKKLTVKSEWGGPTKQSLIDRKFFKDNKGFLFDHVSDIESFKNDKHSQTVVSEEDIQLEHKNSSERIMFRNEVQKGLQQLREFKDKTNIFYNQKLTQIKSLSNRLNDYHPLRQISKIKSKIAISTQTINLINSRIMRNA